MSKEIDNGVPAFPVQSLGQDGLPNFETDLGMTLRQYAAIKLRVPSSGTPWLDKMIQKSRHDMFSGQILAGMAASPSRDIRTRHAIADIARSHADAMVTT